MNLLLELLLELLLFVCMYVLGALTLEHRVKRWLASCGFDRGTRAGKLEQPRDFLDCTRGLAVRPKRLAVLIFYSMLPNGEFDQTSLHAGCDVKEGVKWAANFWFWNTEQKSGELVVNISRELTNRSRLRFERTLA